MRTPGKHQGHTRDTPGKYQGHTRDTLGTCQGHARETPGKHQGHARDTPGKHQGHTRDTPGTHQGNTRETPHLGQCRLLASEHHFSSLPQPWVSLRQKGHCLLADILEGIQSCVHKSLALLNWKCKTEGTFLTC